MWPIAWTATWGLPTRRWPSCWTMGRPAHSTLLSSVRSCGGRALQDHLTETATFVHFLHQVALTAAADHLPCLADADKRGYLGYYEQLLKLVRRLAPTFLPHNEATVLNSAAREAWVKNWMPERT